MKRIFLKMTKSKFHFVTKLILMVFFTIITASCASDNEQPPEAPEIPSEISQEIKDLIYFRGDENAPIVLINAQGGPDNVLATEEVNFISENFNTTDILTVNVHQAQTLHPNILDDTDITLNQAITFNAESIEILDQVITYFKNEGRTVYVLGVSFGAFMVQDLIATKGIDTADRYLIMVGRLDINNSIWQALVEGRYGFFENGITPVIDADPDPDVVERNIGRIAAGLAMNRYTQLLNPIEDLSKVTYVYGTTDEAVGSLTTEEVQFLESKNVNIIAGNGDHDETINNFFQQAFNEAFGIE